MKLKKIFSFFIVLSFFLEHLGLNSFEIHFNSQVLSFQHLDIDADGSIEHLNESLGQVSVFKTKKVFYKFVKIYVFKSIVILKHQIFSDLALKHPYIFYNEIFKPPIKY